ncbi:MAG: electron transport complex subunit RsxC [Desulfuromonadales bacterium]|nr:electron transport complex subunit RsxC [Desulfuromonadales bacterium]
MSSSALKTFPGGLHPPDSKQATAGKPIELSPLPVELILPLSQHIGAPAEACVEVGEFVLKGQMIGRAKGFVSVPIHASTSGEVIAVEPRIHPSGRLLPSIVIKPDGEESWCELFPADPEKLTAAELIERILQAGIVGMGGATFPTHVKLSPPDDKPIDTLILNGVECEPFLTADHRLMLEAPKQILAGINILRKILQVEKTWIGIEANKPDAIALLQELCAGTGIEVVPLAVKYPQGAEKQLILALTGREVPSGSLPMEVGVVVQNVATAAAIATAVIEGKPLVDRVGTISGPLIKKPKNLRFHCGTPLQHLVDLCGGIEHPPAKILAGGPMMGQTQLTLEAPATRGTSGLLLFAKEDLPLRPQTPCIRCGRCVQVCPAGLLPTTIAAYVRLDLIEAAEQTSAMDCIECGCCSYSCPAAIPLVQSLRQAKGMILEKRRGA